MGGLAGRPTAGWGGGARFLHTGSHRRSRRRVGRGRGKGSWGLEQRQGEEHQASVPCSLLVDSTRLQKLPPWVSNLCSQEAMAGCGEWASQRRSHKAVQHWGPFFDSRLPPGLFWGRGVPAGSPPAVTPSAAEAEARRREHMSFPECFSSAVFTSPWVPRERAHVPQLSPRLGSQPHFCCT